MSRLLTLRSLTIIGSLLCIGSYLLLRRLRQIQRLPFPCPICRSGKLITHTHGVNSRVPPPSLGVALGYWLRSIVNRLAIHLPTILQDLISDSFKSGGVRLAPFSISLKGTYNTSSGKLESEKITPGQTVPDGTCNTVLWGPPPDYMKECGEPAIAFEKGFLRCRKHYDEIMHARRSASA